ncbi:hypothetical protein [Ralstonia sp. ASV6]|uniref:hypothetical protein n=1 Tax=Ralstonia sp. ASV6 TaxID=2795124 RepID=UPI0018EB217C|nr:hypothetical protein [Ralstonia sp. ASV6]
MSTRKSKPEDAALFAALPSHPDHPDKLDDQPFPWDQPDYTTGEHEAAPLAQGDQGMGPTTLKAREATVRLFALAAAARDAYQEVGKAIIEMRDKAPRDAVVRRQWLDAVGLDSYSRPAQVSGLVKWAALRDEIEASGVVKPLMFTSQAILAAYEKGPGKERRKEADDRGSHLEHKDITGHRFEPQAFLQAERREIEREVMAYAARAQRQGESALEAARAALARQSAAVQVAAELVEQLLLQDGASEPDETDDF